MDSSETAPGLSTDEREPTRTAATPETDPGAAAGGEATEVVDTPPDADAAGETASDSGEAVPRPRRRRRRRRRPAQGAAAPDAGALNQAFAGDGSSAEIDAPAETGETPAAAAAVEIGAEHGGSETSAEAGTAGAPEGGAPDQPLLRLRNRSRRRRRRPPVLGLLPGHSDPVAPGDGAPPAIAGIRAALAPGQRSFSVPRRQRRHAPLSGEPATLSSVTGAPQATGSAGETAAEPGGAPPRARHRRRRRPTEAATPTGGQPRETAAAAGLGGERVEGRGGQRERDQRDRGPRDRGPRDRGRDRGDRRDQGAPPRRIIERKLYSVDAIVDRGFEDLEEDGGETRRVHWTIVKRTTADQISRKPVATVYVVQREGADTEFPTLGTARSAVNKTIVHPEKLTPSKAERAIAKK